MTQRVLFVCTANAARSVMAEAFLRSVAGNHFEVASAGTSPGPLRTETVRTLQNHGIDIENRQPQGIDTVASQHWDYVITLCNEAQSCLPSLSDAAYHLHWSIADPSAAPEGAERDRAFEQAAEHIQDNIRQFLDQTNVWPEAVDW